MTLPNLQKTPYLRTQWKFPAENTKDLAYQNNQAYIDVAAKVNERTIGIHAVKNQMVTGENWYINETQLNNKQQTLRQIYPFDSTDPIPHSIDLQSLDLFTKCTGSFTDGNNWYGVIFGSTTIITGQLSFYIDPVNIVLVFDGTTPSVSNGIIILEWLSSK